MSLTVMDGCVSLETSHVLCSFYVLFSDAHRVRWSSLRASMHGRYASPCPFVQKRTSSSPLCGGQCSCDAYRSDLSRCCNDTCADSCAEFSTCANSIKPHTANHADARAEYGSYGSSLDSDAHSVDDPDKCSDENTYSCSHAVSRCPNEHTFSRKRGERPR